MPAGVSAERVGRTDGLPHYAGGRPPPSQEVAGRPHVPSDRRPASAGGRPAARHRMRALLRRGLTLVQDEGRRQLRTRVERLARPALPPSYHWVRWRRVPVAARVDDHLRLGEHTTRTAGLVTARLAAAGLGYWWVPQPHGEGRRLAVRASDRAVVLALLAALPGPSWY